LQIRREAIERGSLHVGQDEVRAIPQQPVGKLSSEFAGRPGEQDVLSRKKMHDSCVGTPFPENRPV